MYDVQQIMDLIPQRYPFLLIDRVIELVPGEKVLALKNVSINEHFFLGHFPGKPIMPGVLIMEGMAQAGALLASMSRPKEDRDKLIYLAAMDKVKFRQPVIPGDQIIYELKIIKLRKKAAKMFGIATVEDKRVAEAELMAISGEKI